MVIETAKKEKVIFRLDPRTKILLMLTISVVVLVGYNGMILLLRPWILCIPFILLALERKWASAIKMTAAYLLLTYWDRILFFLADIGPLVDILRLIFTLIAFFMPCIAMGRYLIASTTVSQFIAAMQRLHISQNIIIPFVVLFRFFPTIAEEYHSIRDAMRMRGVSFRKGPVAMLEYRMVPLMISLVKIGDELSAAAATRGLGDGEKRTNVCEIGFEFQDILMAVISLAVLILLLLEVFA